MEIKWLEDFIALAQCNNFSRAAESRHLTQSGFSRRIQALEQWTGAPLVDRSTYPPSLTAAGRALLEVADDVAPKPQRVNQNHHFRRAFTSRFLSAPRRTPVHAGVTAMPVFSPAPLVESC